MSEAGYVELPVIRWLCGKGSSAPEDKGLGDHRVLVLCDVRAAGSAQIEHRHRVLLPLESYRDRAPRGGGRIQQEIHPNRWHTAALGAEFLAPE